MIQEPRLQENQESRLQENREPRLQENRGIIMLSCLLIRKVTRLANSLSQKILEVTRLMLVLRVLGPRKRVQWPELYRMDHRGFGERG